jgi:hypothetical protein
MAPLIFRSARDLAGIPRYCPVLTKGARVGLRLPQGAAICRGGHPHLFQALALEPGWCSSHRTVARRGGARRSNFRTVNERRDESTPRNSAQKLSSAPAIRELSGLRLYQLAPSCTRVNLPNALGQHDRGLPQPLRIRHETYHLEADGEITPRKYPAYSANSPARWLERGAPRGPPVATRTGALRVASRLACSPVSR